MWIRKRLDSTSGSMIPPLDLCLSSSFCSSAHFCLKLELMAASSTWGGGGGHTSASSLVSPEPEDGVLFAYLGQLRLRSGQKLVQVIGQRLPAHRTHHRQLLGVHPGPGLVLLQLLLPLAELALRVAGVAAQAVAVEVVVAAGLGEGLALLERRIGKNARKRSDSLFCLHIHHVCWIVCVKLRVLGGETPT